MTLWNYIKSNMLANENQTMSENDAHMTFEEVVIWAEQFSERLKNIHCCAILCSSEMAASMSLLACFAAGVTALPLSMRYGEIHCNKILNTIDPDAIIMDTNGKIVVYRIKDSQYIIPPEHPAIIMCTSGTTGTPKGAMLSEKNIISNVEDITEYFDIDKRDTILISRPIYHCAVLSGELITALVKGCKIRFYSESFNPRRLLEIIQKYYITVFCATPTLISLIMRFKRNSNINTLKHLCISGECMGRELGIRIRNAFPHVNIYHVYGLTEACPRVSYLPPESFDDYPDCVGIPLKSVSIKILDHLGNPCSKNEEGILYVKGDNVMIGYYRDPKKTRNVFKDGWLCTGDVASINDKNFLKIKGRNDDLIIRSGMNIYPAEIESVLKGDDRVRDVFVYGIGGDLSTEIAMKISGDFQSVSDVKQLCRERLPEFQIPSFIELVDELKKSASGKVIRKKQI